ncbi:MAG: HAMP domain-containing sensor histidine kinase [Hyphomicrobiales bacterium]|nr:HAMP domain-containing sensor histidine kinase [Hyphomicrobiales bacterium]
MQLEENQPAVNTQGKLKDVCFSVGLTTYFILTCFFMAGYAETSSAIASIGKDNLFFGLFFSNLILISLLYLSKKYNRKERNYLQKEVLISEQNFNLLSNKKESVFFAWDINNKNIHISKNKFSIDSITSRNAMKFEEFIKKISNTEDTFYQIANDIISKSISFIDIDFKYQTNISDKWYNLKGDVIRDSSNNPYLLGIMIDITSNKNQEINHNKIQATLDEVINSLPISFVLWNSKDQLVMCNSKFKEFYSLAPSITKSGSSRSEILKLSTKCVFEQDITNIDTNRSKNIKDIKEIQLRDKRWLLTTNIKTDSGYNASVGLDISDQKTNENRLLENENDLINKVEELDNLRRKQDIQSKHLIKLAEKYNTEKNNFEEQENDKSKFLVNMSHELRTPLNAIIGFSELLKKNKINNFDKVNEYANYIHSSGAELLEIISNIQDMSHLEKENVKINKSDQKIIEILDEVLEEFSNDLFKKNIQVKNYFNFPGSLYCNRIALKQIITNVISNSIKYNKEAGSISIKSSIDNGWINLEISDNGHGIAKEKLNNIFRPFNKSRKLAIINQEGAGLGLPLTKSLLDTHDGTININSNRGKGTTVIISLPLISENANYRPRKLA